MDKVNLICVFIKIKGNIRLNYESSLWFSVTESLIQKYCLAIRTRWAMTRSDIVFCAPPWLSFDSRWAVMATQGCDPLFWSSKQGPPAPAHPRQSQQGPQPLACRKPVRFALSIWWQDSNDVPFSWEGPDKDQVGSWHARGRCSTYSYNKWLITWGAASIFRVAKVRAKQWMTRGTRIRMKWNQ